MCMHECVYHCSCEHAFGEEWSLRLAVIFLFCSNDLYVDCACESSLMLRGWKEANRSLH